MNNKDFAIGLLTGAIIGGAIALLYAPRSGKETREMLKSKAMETGEHVKGFATETVEKVREGASQANRKVQAVQEALRS